MNPLIIQLAKDFDKPYEYAVRCVEFHKVSLPLPSFRYAGDGLEAFFSDMTALFSIEPSLTKQEFTAECDINTIMERFKASGGDPSVLPLTTRKPRYGDFTSMPDSYHSALNYINDTKSEFMKLDANVRARFHNDPQEFLNFVSDPANSAELIKLGLAVAPLASSMVEGTSGDVPLGQETGGASSSSKKPVSKGSKGGDEGA